MRKRERKLVLAKETVVKLELAQVAGGSGGATCTCTNSNYVDCPETWWPYDPVG